MPPIVSAQQSAPPKIGYLTNIYPSVSHTFIRREIHGLEARGYQIERFAVRCGENFVDPADIEEARKTCHLMNGSKLKLLLRALPELLARPRRVYAAIRAMLAMNYRSERGIVRHLAYLFEAAKLVGLAAERGVMHIHVHFGTNAASVARLAFILGGPSYSMTIHGPDEFDAPIAFSLAEKIFDARFVVAITDYCASQLMRWCPYAQWDKIFRVHCTVPAEWFTAASPVPADSKQLVCIGRLSPQKGQLLLLDAMRKVVDAGVPARLVLVGDGEMRQEIERRIERLGLQEHVVLSGWQTEAQVREHLKDSRALVLASFAEGLPMVIMEAMAAQRPVVTTYITGIPELVRHGDHGWKVPPGNVDALAEGMIAALTAPIETLNAMGARGAQQVRLNHTVETEVDKLDTLFRERI